MKKYADLGSKKDVVIGLIEKFKRYDYTVYFEEETSSFELRGESNVYKGSIPVDV